MMNGGRIMERIEPSNRCAYIDALRLFAVNMVIVLHCICYYFTDAYAGRPMWWVFGLINELARTGVPLFFMISGYLLLSSPNTLNIPLFYKSRLSKFMGPFLFWDIVYYCFFRVRNGQSVLSFDFFRELLRAGSSYHLWFMYSMILLCFMLPFVKKIMDGYDTKTQLLFFVIVVFQTTIRPLFNVIFDGKLLLFLSEDGVVGYLGYMVLGYILGKQTFSGNQLWYAGIGGGIAWIVFACCNCLLALSGRGYAFNGGYTVNHYIEAACLFVLFKSCSWESVKKPLQSASGLCLSVYFIHVLFLELIMPYIQGLSLSFFCLVLCVSTALLSFGTAFMYQHIKGMYKR